jgi:hypothetical protein
MSNEHVWPKWMRDLLPPDVLRADYTYVYRDSARGEVRRVPRQPIFNKRVRAVCEPCNNGWMSRVEDQVKPYISGMLQGRGRQLHEGGQTSIARWGALNAFVAQRSFKADPVESILPEHFRELYDLRNQARLPDAVTVYTAKTAWSDGHARPGLFHLNGIARGDVKDGTQDDGYLLTFSALDLVVQVFRIYGDERAEFSHSPRLAPSVRRIWPPTDSFVWPPGPSLTQAGLLALAGDDPVIRAGF